MDEAALSSAMPDTAIYDGLARETILSPGMVRHSVYETHPMVTNSVMIPTPPLIEAYDIVAEALVHRRTGVCFFGDFRVGKTKGIDLIRETLPQTFPKLPTCLISAKDHDKPTEKALYTDMLRDLRHAAADVGTATARRHRLVSYFQTLTQRSAENRLLLFVDEAQNYSSPDLTRLRDITNDLEREGTTVITALFGDLRLLDIRAALRASNRRDILSRFLLNLYPYRALSSEKDVRTTLAAMDDPAVSEYPRHSGISFTEFFLPDLYASGWRLADESAHCWNAFTAIAGGHEEGLAVGMQWIASAVKGFLFPHWEERTINRNFSHQLWHSAVMGSGFASAFGLGPAP
ncbi:ATP-binding protein [Achromobacter aloeverae]